MSKVIEFKFDFYNAKGQKLNADFINLIVWHNNLDAASAIARADGRRMFRRLLKRGEKIEARLVS